MLRKPWLIGGLLGLIYFIITYGIDIGACGLESSYCTGVTGLVLLTFDFPAVFLLQLLGLGFLWAIPIANFFIGAVLGYGVGVVYKKFKC